MAGGVLEFVLSSKPSSDWGVPQEARPYSMTVKPVAAAPYTSAATILFEDKVSMDLNSNTPASSRLWPIETDSRQAECL